MNLHVAIEIVLPAVGLAALVALEGTHVLVQLGNVASEAVKLGKILSADAPIVENPLTRLSVFQGPLSVGHAGGLSGRGGRGSGRLRRAHQVCGVAHDVDDVPRGVSSRVVRWWPDDERGCRGGGAGAIAAADKVDGASSSSSILILVSNPLHVKYFKFLLLFVLDYPKKIFEVCFSLTLSA